TEEERANEILRNALYNTQEARLKEETLKKSRTSQYCQDLQQQLVMKEQQKRCRHEDTLVEKKMLDDVIRVLSDEDKRAIQQKREQTAKLRHEMVTFQQAREAWRKKQKQAVILEERVLEKQRSSANTFNDIVIAERERKLRVKEDINKRVAAHLLAEQEERRHREDIIKQLQEQEYLEMNAQNDIAVREKAERVKRDTEQALTQQMEEHRRNHKEEARRALEFRKLTEAKIAEDNAKEDERKRKSHEKSKLYAAELMRQIEDNARRRKMEQELEKGRAQYVWDCDKTWRTEVAEERKKIIEEHAPHLVGYLQAGVLNPEDIPALKEGARKHEELANLDIESLTKTQRPKRHDKCNDQCKILRQY
ncbi:hypothetical protein ACJJTC_018621, partial [Scirpophaga incertulas]